MKKMPEYLTDKIETQTLGQLMESKQSKVLKPRGDNMWGKGILEEDIIRPTIKRRK